MPRTLSTRTETEIAKKAGSKPIWLVYIGYGTPLRYSSGPTLTWNSQTWTAQDLIVTVAPDKNTGTLQIQNTDYVFGGKVVTDGIADVPITIYQLYGDSPYDSADAELLFDGVGGQARPGVRWVHVGLELAPTACMYSPRTRCTKEIGFNHLPPDGMTISLNGENYTLEVQPSG